MLVEFPPPVACSIFFRMRSKGPRFTRGVWGLKVCSLEVAFASATIRNHSQPFATVRNRSQPFATVRARSLWPCLWRVLQTAVTFGGFKCRVAWFRLARDIHNVSKVVSCDRRNTCARFSKHDLHFFVAGTALWRPPSSFCVAGAARVVLRVLRELQCQGCVKW